MSEENVYMVLGCYGRKEDDFTLCPKVENRILLLDDSLDGLDKMWEYFDGVKLIDKPLIDLNAIRNVIFRMQDKFDQRSRKLWSEKEFNLIERFTHMHKACGMYIKLITACEEDFFEDKIELIKITGSRLSSDNSEPVMSHGHRFKR